MGEAVSFDPAIDPLPEALAWHPGYSGPAVLLLAGARDPNWAADVAVALASAWARSGRRVVLADLHLEEPVLHERVGLENRDGAVDLCLYGASLSRSAHAVPSAGFHLIPAGTYTADAGSVYGHPRWQKIIAGFRDAQAWLLVFAPADSPYLRELGGWATDAILLGTPPQRGPADPLLPPGIGVRAVAEPSGGTPAVLEEELDREGYLAPIPAADPSPEPELSADTPVASGPSPAPATLRQVLEEPTEEPEHRRRWWPLLLALLLVALIAAAAALVFGRFELGRQEPEAAPAAVSLPVQAAPAAPVPAVTPATQGVPLPYTVFVTAYQFYDAARRQMEVEQGRFPQTTFYVSPEPEQGIVYYKVFAGSLPDSGAATQLRDQLVEMGAIDRNDVAAASSLVKYNPLSFALGEFASRLEAVARADSLSGRGVPAYPVQASADNAERWRVYGGAFADSVSAEFMRSQLVEAGLEAQLVQRVGSREGR